MTTQNRVKLNKPWKDKIVGSEKVDPKKLVPHPQNFRTHSTNQTEVADDLLGELGWVQQVVVNKRTGRIIDGHMRAKLASERGEKSIPVLYVDLDETEERKALATFDPLGKMAGLDVGTFDDLVSDLQTDSLFVREMLKGSRVEGDEDEPDEAEEQLAKNIPEMEMQPFEGYDYIILLFRNSQDYYAAAEKFEIKEAATPVPNSDKLKVGLGRVVDGAKAMKKLCK